MKTCLICHHESPSEAATCPRCGEGSWSAVAAPKQPEAPPAEKPAPATVAAPQQQQLSRKGNRR
jgi:hypothetical protein